MLNNVFKSIEEIHVALEKSARGRAIYLHCCVRSQLLQVCAGTTSKLETQIFC